MSSFEHFWNSSENSIESVNSSELQTSLATNIQGILMAGTLSVFSFNNTQVEEAKFSEEVANYVTGDEFISSLSNNLGEPKVTETEEDFVERASRLLRTILEEKFKI